MRPSSRVFLFRRKEFDGIVDGIVLAGFIGVGFAFTENILYFGRAFLAGSEQLGVTGGLFAAGIDVRTARRAGALRPSPVHDDDRHRVGHRGAGTGRGCARCSPRSGAICWRSPCTPRGTTHRCQACTASLSATSSSWCRCSCSPWPSRPGRAVARARPSPDGCRSMCRLAGWWPRTSRCSRRCHGGARRWRGPNRPTAAASSRALHDFQLAGTELAFLRERAERGITWATSRRESGSCSPSSAAVARQCAAPRLPDQERSVSSRRWRAARTRRRSLSAACRSSRSSWVSGGPPSATRGGRSGRLGHAQVGDARADQRGDSVDVDVGSGGLAAAQAGEEDLAGRGGAGVDAHHQPARGERELGRTERAVERELGHGSSSVNATVLLSTVSRLAADLQEHSTVCLRTEPVVTHPDTSRAEISRSEVTSPPVRRPRAGGHRG